MRGFLILTVVIGTLWGIDAVVLDGRYRKVAWLEANYQGDKFSYQVRYWLNKSGL
jgi:hypothetical protein